MSTVHRIETGSHAPTDGGNEAVPSYPTREVPDVPILHNGDRLNGPEFERRYRAMPYVKKAELINGRVYIPSADFYLPEGNPSAMASPVSLQGHAFPHLLAGGWICVYLGSTPGIMGGDNGTVRLDLNEIPQPDLFLFVLPSHGGRARISADDYVQGGPELVVESAHTTASDDLHEKLDAYRRNGVREYVVWRVDDAAIDWFVLRDGAYERMAPTPEGFYKSESLLGLWLNIAAMLAGDINGYLATLQQGLASPEHAAFVERLRAEAARIAALAPAPAEEPRP